MNTIAIIGGGASGMMAAIFAARKGAKVLLLEQNDRLGKKILVTGNGRCNYTNTYQDTSCYRSEQPDFITQVLDQFPAEKVIAFFRELGIYPKDRNGYLYPYSDQASAVRDVLEQEVYRLGVDVRTGISCTGIQKTNERFSLQTSHGSLTVDQVILCNGSKAAPSTGSDGSGYRLAMKLGHDVTELKPSLIPFESKDPVCEEMMGLSLKNVAVKIYDESGKVLYTDFGEMMFTHFGVTGPVILSASAHVKDRDISKLTLSIDLKPALDEKTLDARLLSDFKKNANKDFANSLSALLPSKMIEPFLKRTGVDAHKKINSITKEERFKILSVLKDFKIPLHALRPIEEAIITSGGIDVKQINPKTMESKLIPGIYFAGEIIDVDAYTGGFNLQIAYSTGFIAGKSAAEY